MQNLRMTLIECESLIEALLLNATIDTACLIGGPNLSSTHILV
jgi:hypothetical protein